MNRKFLLMFLSLCLLLLTACSEGEKDTIQEIPEVISDSSVMGYSYYVEKDADQFSWEVSYKDDKSVIKETEDNAKDLEKFMMTVNDSNSELVRLILSGCYLLIIVVVTLILYKKKRKMLNSAGTIILGAFGAIAAYIAFTSYFKLSSLLHDVKYYYFLLVN